MRQVETEHDPSWTLEFAVIENNSEDTSAVVDLGRSHEGLVLPFPAYKEKPNLPAAIVRNNIGKMIIVYAVINTEGKMEQISIKASPDPLLNDPVLKASGKWVFRPARLDGEVVSTKALLGIPLWLPDWNL